MAFSVFLAGIPQGHGLVRTLIKLEIFKINLVGDAGKVNISK